MSDNPWSTPEAIAYFQSEYDHAIEQAKMKLAKACAWDGPLHQMGKMPGELLDEIADNLGRKITPNARGSHLCRSVGAGVLGRRRDRQAVDAGPDTEPAPAFQPPGRGQPLPDAFFLAVTTANVNESLTGTERRSAAPSSGSPAIRPFSGNVGCPAAGGSVFEVRGRSIPLQNGLTRTRLMGSLPREPLQVSV